MIAEWRDSDGKLRKGKFGPAAVRKVLDDRDGFTERKREAHYKLLCELAAHPTNIGFKMLLADGKSPHCGPFLNPEAMKAALEELAKLQISAVGTFTRLVDANSSEIFDAKLNFLEARTIWLSRYAGKEDDGKEFEIIKELRERVAEVRKRKAAKSKLKPSLSYLYKLDAKRMSWYQWVVY